MMEMVPILVMSAFSSTAVIQNMRVRLGQDLIRSAPGDSFGRSVALSADGSIATGDNGNQTGSVRVYEI